MWLIGASGAATRQAALTVSTMLAVAPREAVFGIDGVAAVGHIAFLVGFALIAWRLAISFMERKLIL